MDISPLCNLRCPACVHASRSSEPAVGTQQFHAAQRMPLSRFRDIIGEAAGKTSAVSLYYLGDPLMNRDLEEMCSVCATAGVNSHISTNFSFDLSDARIGDLVECGLTHVTVCIDGLSQTFYERARTGGRLEVVLSNLRRLADRRAHLRRRFPQIEVQFLRYAHNRHEARRALAELRRAGADAVTLLDGDTINWAAAERGAPPRTMPRTAGAIPNCVYPYFVMVVKYDGDVIPCCNHRRSEQYATDGDARPLGNLFETSLRAMWNSDAYRHLRRFIANPKGIAADSAKQSFCHGCDRVYSA